MSSIKINPSSLPTLVALSALGLFFLFTYHLHQTPPAKRYNTFESVVIPAPIQTVIYGGDRFLGANIESARAASANNVFDARESTYRIRARKLVAQLNPCHEDNYWIGNAALSWGGAVDDGLELLHSAMQCRYWDEWPAFFYGFNQYFFKKDIDAASNAIEIAAQRSKESAASFRKFSIMLMAGEIDDTRSALAMIERERDQANDPKLREMLDDRVKRLSGLIQLQDAQTAYETKFRQPLEDPKQLISSGMLDAFPVDPLGLGYEFKDQMFHLSELTIQ